MTPKVFIEKHCQNCGSQKCGGVDTEWLNDCQYRFDLDGYINGCDVMTIKRTLVSKINEFKKQYPFDPPRYVVISSVMHHLLMIDSDVYFSDEKDGPYNRHGELVYGMYICISPKVKKVEDIQIF